MRGALILTAGISLFALAPSVFAQTSSPGADDHYYKSQRSKGAGPKSGSGSSFSTGTSAKGEGQNGLNSQDRAKRDREVQEALRKAETGLAKSRSEALKSKDPEAEAMVRMADQALKDANAQAQKAQEAERKRREANARERIAISLDEKPKWERHVQENRERITTLEKKLQEIDKLQKQFANGTDMDAFRESAEGTVKAGLKAAKKELTEIPLPPRTIGDIPKFAGRFDRSADVQGKLLETVNQATALAKTQQYVMEQSDQDVRAIRTEIEFLNKENTLGEQRIQGLNRRLQELNSERY